VKSLFVACAFFLSMNEGGQKGVRISHRAGWRRVLSQAGRGKTGEERLNAKEQATGE
jgi:hypothetical protein